MKKILVLSLANSCRSQMAEGFLKNLVDESKVSVFSAGVNSKAINPRAISIMEEDGIDISSQKSKSINDVLDNNFDFLISLCENSKKQVSSISSKALKVHYEFPDPADVDGSENDIYFQFLTVREMIKMFCEEFVEENNLLK